MPGYHNWAPSGSGYLDVLLGPLKEVNDLLDKVPGAQYIESAENAIGDIIGSLWGDEIQDAVCCHV
jgi:hypothetical protein